MERYDSETGYCRSLGHNVPFSYCRTVASGLPCRSIADCWYENIPVVEYLEDLYSPGELEKIFSPPADRVSTLIELIENAKKGQSPSR